MYVNKKKKKKKNDTNVLNLRCKEISFSDQICEYDVYRVLGIIS